MSSAMPERTPSEAGESAAAAGRRTVLRVGGAVLAAPLVAWAQRPQSVPRVGFVSPTSPGPRDEAFRQGLRELGHVEGRDVVVEMRFADGDPERLRALVDELVRRKVDVLVVGSTLGARAAKSATATIPVVFAGSSDPVAGGIVASLARPAGNLTGTSTAYGDGFAGKWLELLKEAVPSLSRAAALWSSSNAAAMRFVDELQAAGSRLGVRLDVHQAANDAELDAALAAIGRGEARAFVVTPSPFAASRRDRLVRFAAERQLPAAYFVGDFAEAGGLISYGPSIAEAYRRASAHVDRILKGAKPGDLPVEQPTKIELIVNRRTARALGLAVPASLLLRADRVID